MQKQYYDHPSVLCKGCAFFIPAGQRLVCGKSETFGDGCRASGYALHAERYTELADDCSMFLTPAQYIAREQNKKRRNGK